MTLQKTVLKSKLTLLRQIIQTTCVQQSDKWFMCNWIKHISTWGNKPWKTYYERHITCMFIRSHKSLQIVNNKLFITCTVFRVNLLSTIRKLNTPWIPLMQPYKKSDCVCNWCFTDVYQLWLFTSEDRRLTSPSINVTRK